MKIKVVDMQKPKTGFITKEFGHFRYEIKWYDGSITRPKKDFSRELLSSGKRRYLVNCKYKVKK